MTTHAILPAAQRPTWTPHECPSRGGPPRPTTGVFSMSELSSAERESLVAAYIATLHTEPTGSVYRPHPATWWGDLDGANRNEIRLIAERRNITLIESR